MTTTIELNHISKNIRGVSILNDITLTLTSGKIYGLRGKNGSGKTMLMRLICGLIFPTTGEVKINGKQLGKELNFPESVGILIENPAFVDSYSGFQNLKVIAAIQGNVDDAEIRHYLDLVGLDPNDKKKYRKYSLGMKQRLGIACAIMGEPDIIILDEPINALDESGVVLVRTLLNDLKEKGKLILVACHDKEELDALADEIYTMDAGVLKRGEEV